MHFCQCTLTHFGHVQNWKPENNICYKIEKNKEIIINLKEQRWLKMEKIDTD